MNAKITFPEIVDLIAESTSTTKRVCELFLRELFATVSQSLIDGEDVKIKGVGTFKVTRVKPRKSVSVNTGGSIEISGHKKLTFTPDKSLSEAVNQPFAQFETVFLDDAVTDDVTKSYNAILPDGYDISSMGGTSAYVSKLQNWQNTYRRYRDISIVVTVVVYALSLVDAYVDAQLFDFDISPDLSMQVEPAVYYDPVMQRANGEVHLAITF